MFSLQNKTAIITGGGSGIGRAIAQLFAKQGAIVYIIELDEAAAKAHSDRNFGITLAERALAASGIGRLPAPMNAVVGDTFMLSFDRTLATINPPPEAQTGVRAADLFDAQNQDYLHHRAYLIGMAKQEAGELAQDTWEGARPGTVFDESGNLRPFEEIPEQQGDDPLNDLRNVAHSPPSVTPRAGTPEWGTALGDSSDIYESYNRRVDERHAGMVWTHKGMTNWYRNRHGRVFAIMPWRLVEYWKMTSAFEPAEYQFN